MLSLSLHRLCRLTSLVFSCLLLSTTAAGQDVAVGQLDATISPPELWYGVIKTPAVWLRTAVYLTEENGEWSGHAISLDQKKARMPLTKISRGDNRWTLEFKSVNAEFQGTEATDHRSVEGVFTQNGVPLALNLQRLAAIPPLPASKVYRGELNAIIRKLSMQLRIIDNERIDGKQLVLVDSLSDGFTSFVGTLEQTDNQRIVRVPALKAVWKGPVTEDDSLWTGNWTQGFIPLPLEWKRETQPLDELNLKPKRPQTPQPPFPYEVREVSWTNDTQPNVELSGTLTLPRSEHPVPAIILISGSGPQDRDETIAEHQPFWVIADYLTRQGFAVLRYDDRGTGVSTGNHQSAVTADFISDALSAWTFLSTQAGVDAEKIGLLGHSEGSSIALSAAVQNPRIPFLILMAGAGWDGRQIVVEQTLEMARRQGASVTSLLALRTLMEQHSDLVLAQPEPTEFATQVDQLVDAYLESEKLTDDEREVTEAVLAGRLKELNSNWYRDFLQRLPSVEIPKLKIPMLAVWGSEDVQVPAEGNRQAMQAALERSQPHTLTRLEILPKLNHLLQPCQTGLIQEYGTIETTIAPVALEKFAEFLRSVTAEQ